MKLYYHPVSTTSRPVMWFAHENGIELELSLVDLFKGENLGPPYSGINPVCQVPMLEDGDFRLAESSAILKYLADKIDSPAYPKDLRERARVNERMDFLNTSFYRDFGYGLVYPQVLPPLRYEDERVQQATLARASTATKRFLAILDQHLIGSSRNYLCGASVTIADHFGASMLTLGEVIHLDYSAYPNVSRWLATMKARPSWPKVNEGFYAYFVAPFKDATFVGL